MVSGDFLFRQLLTNSSFEDVSHDKRNKYDAVVTIHGVQLAEMDNLTFSQSSKLNMHLVVEGLIIGISNTTSSKSEEIESNDEAYQCKNI